MKEFREQLYDLNEKRQRYHKLQERLEMLMKQQMILESQEDNLYKIIVEEEVGVETLEKLTFQSIINSLLNIKFEELDKEREQLYLNRMKYEKIKKEHKNVSQSIKDINDELRNLVDVEGSFKVLMDQVATQVLASDSDESSRLLDLLSQSYKYERDLVNMLDVVHEGDFSLKELDEIKGVLLDASKESSNQNRDAGLLSIVKKFRYLDDARIILNRVQWALRKYYLAASRVGGYDASIINDFLTREEYWIEGIFNDYSLNISIKKLIDEVDMIIVEILKIDESIRKEIKKIEMEKEGIQISIERLFGTL